MFDRGWTDGLPVVPPTEARVLRMLDGTTAAPDEIVAVVPPDLVECTVEKVAINAVHGGLQARVPAGGARRGRGRVHRRVQHARRCWRRRCPSARCVIVNGPIRRAIGMNSGVNVLGQGNRANLDDRPRAAARRSATSAAGAPAASTARRTATPASSRSASPRTRKARRGSRCSVERGFAPTRRRVTLFPGEGPRGVVDQLAREPESLARTLAACLRTVHHPKLPLGFDAILVARPRARRVFRTRAGRSSG